MKKIGVVLILFLFVFPLVLNLVLAQEIPGLPSQLQQDPEELIEGIKNQTETKWEYLGKEWQNMLLKNKFVSAMDSVLQKVSFLFTLLFGMPYSLSITLLVAVILWLLVFITAGKIINSYGFVKGISAYLAGLGIAVILAQLQIFKIIITAVGTFIFSQEAKWARVVLVIVAFFLLVLFFYFSSAISKYLEKKKKKRKEEETEQKQEEIKKFTKGLEKGM